MSGDMNSTATPQGVGLHYTNAEANIQTCVYNINKDFQNTSANVSTSRRVVSAGQGDMWMELSKILLQMPVPLLEYCQSKVREMIQHDHEEKRRSDLQDRLGPLTRPFGGDEFTIEGQNAPLIFTTAGLKAQYDAYELDPNNGRNPAGPKKSVLHEDDRLEYVDDVLFVNGVSQRLSLIEDVDDSNTATLCPLADFRDESHLYARVPMAPVKLILKYLRVSISDNGMADVSQDGIPLYVMAGLYTISSWACVSCKRVQRRNAKVDVISLINGYINQDFSIAIPFYLSQWRQPQVIRGPMLNGKPVYAHTIFPEYSEGTYLCERGKSIVSKSLPAGEEIVETAPFLSRMNQQIGLVFLAGSQTTHDSLRVTLLLSTARSAAGSSQLNHICRPSIPTFTSNLEDEVSGYVCLESADQLSKRDRKRYPAGSKVINILEAVKTSSHYYAAPEELDMIQQTASVLPYGYCDVCVEVAVIFGYDVPNSKGLGKSISQLLKYMCTLERTYECAHSGDPYNTELPYLKTFAEDVDHQHVMAHAFECTRSQLLDVLLDRCGSASSSLRTFVTPFLHLPIGDSSPEFLRIMTLFQSMHFMSGHISQSLMFSAIQGTKTSQEMSYLHRDEHNPHGLDTKHMRPYHHDLITDFAPILQTAHGDQKASPYLERFRTQMKMTSSGFGTNMSLRTTVAKGARVLQEKNVKSSSKTTLSIGSGKKSIMSALVVGELMRNVSSGADSQQKLHDSGFLDSLKRFGKRVVPGKPQRTVQLIGMPINALVGPCADALKKHQIATQNKHHVMEAHLNIDEGIFAVSHGRLISDSLDAAEGKFGTLAADATSFDMNIGSACRQALIDALEEIHADTLVDEDKLDTFLAVFGTTVAGAMSHVFKSFSKSRFIVTVGKWSIIATCENQPTGIYLTSLLNTLYMSKGLKTVLFRKANILIKSLVWGDDSMNKVAIAKAKLQLKVAGSIWSVTADLLKVRKHPEIVQILLILEHWFRVDIGFDIGLFDNFSLSVVDYLQSIVFLGYVTRRMQAYTSENDNPVNWENAATYLDDNFGQSMRAGNSRSVKHTRNVIDSSVAIATFKAGKEMGLNAATLFYPTSGSSQARPYGGLSSGSAGISGGIMWDSLYDLNREGTAVAFPAPQDDITIGERLIAAAYQRITSGDKKQGDFSVRITTNNVTKGVPNYGEDGNPIDPEVWLRRECLTATNATTHPDILVRGIKFRELLERHGVDHYSPQNTFYRAFCAGLGQESTNTHIASSLEYDRAAEVGWVPDSKGKYADFKELHVDNPNTVRIGNLSIKISLFRRIEDPKTKLYNNSPKNTVRTNIAFVILCPVEFHDHFKSISTASGVSTSLITDVRPQTSDMLFLAPLDVNPSLLNSSTDHIYNCTTESEFMLGIDIVHHNVNLDGMNVVADGNLTLSAHEVDDDKQKGRGHLNGKHKIWTVRFNDDIILERKNKVNHLLSFRAGDTATAVMFQLFGQSMERKSHISPKSLFSTFSPKNGRNLVPNLSEHDVLSVIDKIGHLPPSEQMNILRGLGMDDTCVSNIIAAIPNIPLLRDVETVLDYGSVPDMNSAIDKLHLESIISQAFPGLKEAVSRHSKGIRGVWPAVLKMYATSIYHMMSINGSKLLNSSSFKIHLPIITWSEISTT